MALRPLTLGDFYDAAFKTIRFNPRATVGAAVLVGGLTMLLPVVVSAVATFAFGATVEPTVMTGETTARQDVAAVVAFASLGLGMLLLQVGLVLVTGMVARVVEAAALGRLMSLEEAWAATRGKRWRLLGLTLLLNVALLAAVLLYTLVWIALVVAGVPWWGLLVWGLLSVPALLAGLVWLWTRCAYLAPPVLMLEDIGAFGAVGRAWALSRSQFWRTFGIAALTALIGSVAGNLLGVPIALASQLLLLAAPEYGVLTTVVSQALTLVIAVAFVAPFTGAVTCLQYLDQRIRKEGYDVELMTRAGAPEGAAR